MSEPRWLPPNFDADAATVKVVHTGDDQVLLCVDSAATPALISMTPEAATAVGKRLLEVAQHAMRTRQARPDDDREAEAR